MFTATTPLPAGPTGAAIDAFAWELYQQTGRGRPAPYWDTIIQACLAAGVAHEAAVRPGATVGDLAVALTTRPLIDFLDIWPDSPSGTARGWGRILVSSWGAYRGTFRGAVAADLGARLGPFRAGVTA